jgi:hypothetical protein
VVCVWENNMAGGVGRRCVGGKFGM